MASPCHRDWLLVAECCLMMGLPDAETIEQIKAIRWARHVVENDP
jgi:hypothetical protein